MTAVLLTFAVALAASLGLTIPARQIAICIGMVDRPGPRKIHREPTPLLGGVAIYAAIVLTLLLFRPDGALGQMFAIFAASTLLLITGLLDDCGLLHHQVKLLIVMPVAALIVLASGIRAQFFSPMLPGFFGSAADIVLTIFWITGITASFSILDYMDGLCAGVAAIAALFLVILAARAGQVPFSTLGAAVAGAAVGFLKWNFSPAKVFMGDGGAMLLGFLVATLGLKLRVIAISSSALWLAPLFVLAVPILDTTLVSVSRSRRGLIPFTSPGKDHIGHRLANSGLGVRASVLVMYAIGIVSGLLAILATRLTSLRLGALAAVALLAVIAIIALLERLPFERQGVAPEADSRDLKHPKFNPGLSQRPPTHGGHCL